jgi:hypothetical protein
LTHCVGAIAEEGARCMPATSQVSAIGSRLFAIYTARSTR